MSPLNVEVPGLFVVLMVEVEVVSSDLVPELFSFEGNELDFS